MLDKAGACGYDLNAGGHGHAVHSVDTNRTQGEKPLNAAFLLPATDAPTTPEAPCHPQ